MLKIGIVGIGFMGMIHYLAYQRIENVKVVALCESFSGTSHGRLDEN